MNNISVLNQFRDIGSVVGNEVLRAGKAAVKSAIKNAGKRLITQLLSDPFALADKARKAYSIVEREIGAIQHRRKHVDVDSSLLTTLALENAPTKEAYLQVLAQNATYCPF